MGNAPLAVSRAPRIRWTAHYGEPEHAHRAGNPAFTLCGIPARDERLHRPGNRRCLACEALVAELEGRLL